MRGKTPSRPVESEIKAGSTKNHQRHQSSILPCFPALNELTPSKFNIQTDAHQSFILFNSSNQSDSMASVLRANSPVRPLQGLKSLSPNLRNETIIPISKEEILIQSMKSRPSTDSPLFIKEKIQDENSSMYRPDRSNSQSTLMIMQKTGESMLLSGKLSNKNGELPKDLEKKVSILIDENNKLNKIIEENRKKTEIIKVENNSYRETIEIMKKKLEEMAVRAELLLEFEGKMKQMEVMNDRLKFILDENDKLKSADDEKNKRLADMNVLNSQLEYKLGLVGKEVERLNDLLLQVRKNNAAGTIINFGDEIQNQMQKSKDQIAEKTKILYEKTGEVDEWKAKYSLEHVKTLDLEDKLNIIITENERLNKVLKDKILEVKDLTIINNVMEGKIQRLEIQQERLTAIGHPDFSELGRDVKSDISKEDSIQFMSTSKESERIRMLLNEKDQQLEELSNKLIKYEESEEHIKLLNHQLASLQSSLQLLEEKTSNLIKENQRMSKELGEKALELINFKCQASQYDETDSKLRSLMRDKEDLLRVINDKTTLLEKLEIKLKENSQLEAKVVLLQKENELVNQNYLEKLQQLHKLQEENAEYLKCQSEINYLKKYMEDCEESKRNSRQEKQKMSKNNQQITNELNEKRLKLEALEMAVQELTGRNDCLNEENCYLRETNQDYQTKISCLGVENEKLSSHLEAKSNETFLLSNKLSEQEKTHSDALLEQRKQWEFQVRTRIEQELKGAQLNFDFEREKYVQIIEKLESKGESLTANSASIQSKYDSLLKTVLEKEKKIQEILLSTEILKREHKEEFDKLQRESDAASDESNSLRAQIVSLTGTIKQRSEELDRLDRKNSELRNKLTHLIQDLELVYEDDLIREDLFQSFRMELEEKSNSHSKYIGLAITDRDSLMRKLREVIEENSRLNELLKNFKKELEDKVKQAENETNALRKRNSDLEEDKIRSEALKNSLETQTKQLKDIISNNNIEIEKLYGLIQERKTDQDKICSELEQLKKEKAHFMEALKEKSITGRVSEENGCLSPRKTTRAYEESGNLISLNLKRILAEKILSDKESGYLKEIKKKINTTATSLKKTRATILDMIVSDKN